MVAISLHFSRFYDLAGFYTVLYICICVAHDQKDAITSSSLCAKVSPLSYTETGKV